MPHPFRFSASLGGLAIENMVTTAQRAESLGYATVTLPDHLDDQPAPLIGLTAVAAATSTITVLPLVLANDYRHPAVLAKEIATLDAVSGGRVEFGIGAGWMTTDYEHSGINHDRPGVRIRRLREAVDVLQSLFAGEALSHDGEFYSVHGAMGAPHPGRSIPLLLAGGKQKMLTLAGEKADIVGINPGLTAGVIDERAGKDATLAKTDQKIRWVRDGAGDRFDEIELQTRIHMVVITDDRDAVAAELGPLLGLSGEETLASPHALIGSTDQLIDEIRSWRDRWGISFVSINAEQIDEFAPVVEALAGT